MTDLRKLKVSLTKHGAHKVADLIKAFPRDMVLENTWDRYREIKIDIAQTKSNLSADANGILPYFWDEVRKLGDEHVNDLVLLAIIFSHHRLIETMVESSTGDKKGTIIRGKVIEGKEFTNFACVLEELGFAKLHNPQRISYDLNRIFNKLELIPLIIQLLTFKLKKAGWNGKTDFIEECVASGFYKVFGVTETYFKEWLLGGHITETVGRVEPTIEEPDVDEFVFKSGHVQKSEGDVIINRASPKMKAILLHNKIQNKMYNYLIKHFPKDDIGTEINCGIGTSVDIVRKAGDEIIFYEIKTAKSVRVCIREALAQLLEYAHWPDRELATKLVIVSQNNITDQAKKYIRYMRKKFTIPIHYQQYDLDSEELKNSY
jgi:hypothetical protein